MRVASFFLFSLVAGAFSLGAQEAPFYKDKTVRIVVGFTPGGAVDSWARLIARHMSKQIPGNPEFVVLNMPGAGSRIAANYVYGRVKPDGLTLGMLSTGLYMDQLMGRKEAEFDWSRFSWIGSPTRNEEVFYIRTHPAYNTIEDLRRAPEPSRCGATGAGTTSYSLPRLLEETLGLKFQMVLGYPATRDIELALERGEVQCIAATFEILRRDPSQAWLKNGFIHVLVQGGPRRHPLLPEVPTIYELMDRHKTGDDIKRVAGVLLSHGDFGRPMLAPPGMPADRLQILREAYRRTVTSPEFIAEAEKREWVVEYTSGEELEALAKKTVGQPREVVERLKKMAAE